MKINAQFNNWINRNPLSVEHLALFRILFATFYLFTFGGIYRFDWMASFPSFFYNPPPSFGSLFDSFPNVYFLHGVNLVLPVLAIFVLMGYKTRYTSLLFGLLLIVNSSFLNSFGKISHSHLVPFTALIFAFSGWGAKFSFDEFLNKIDSFKNHKIFILSDHGSRITNNKKSSLSTVFKTSSVKTL